jgi:hypothetical protein
VSEPRTDTGRWLLGHQGLINISKPAQPSMRGDEIDLRDAILAIEREAATPEPSDLRAAFDRLTTWPGVVRQWPHTGNWPPEHVVAVSYDDVERIIDAHRCYDESALAEALWDVLYPDPAARVAVDNVSAIIERLRIDGVVR